MPRPAYNKLIRLEREKKILPDHLKLICHENGTFQYPFIKIVDTRTTVDQKYLEGNVAEHLWIDVFPFDGMPEDDKELARLCKKAAMIRTVLGLNFSKSGQGKTFFRKLVKPVLFRFQILRRCCLGPLRTRGADGQGRIHEIRYRYF